MEAGRRKLEDGSWKLEDGSWKLEDGSWKLEDGSWKLEDGSWKTEVNGNFPLVSKSPLLRFAAAGRLVPLSHFIAIGMNQ